MPQCRSRTIIRPVAEGRDADQIHQFVLAHVEPVQKPRYVWIELHRRGEGYSCSDCAYRQVRPDEVRRLEIKRMPGSSLRAS